MHRVAEAIRVFYPEVDRLISNTKKVFYKAPSHIRIFRAIAPGIPLPPQPIITRWGTWLAAANYYADHFDILKQILDDHLNDEDAASKAAAKIQFRKPGIREQPAYIKVWFSDLPIAITKLEDTKLFITESLAIVRTVQTNLANAPGDGAKAASLKLTQVLNKNEGFLKLSNMAEILSGNQGNNSVPLADVNYTAADIAAYSYAPVASCDIERSFSRYKALLADNRRSFTFDNLRKVFVSYCNSADD